MINWIGFPPRLSFATEKPKLKNCLPAAHWNRSVSPLITVGSEPERKPAQNLICPLRWPPRRLRFQDDRLKIVFGCWHWFRTFTIRRQDRDIVLSSGCQSSRNGA